MAVKMRIRTEDTKSLIALIFFVMIKMKIREIANDRILALAILMNTPMKLINIPIIINRGENKLFSLLKYITTNQTAVYPANNPYQSGS